MGRKLSGMRRRTVPAAPAAALIRTRAPRMWDFIAALGLVFAIEGILFAAVPNLAKDALRSAAETPVRPHAV